MATAKANVSLDPSWKAAGQVASLDVNEDAIENMDLGDLHEGHTRSDATLPTISSTPLVGAKAGAMRIDTGTSPATIRVYNGTIESGAQADYSTVVPVATEIGYRWWNETLGIWLVYKTEDGITGFHPEAPGVMLCTNTAGADVVKGACGLFDRSSIITRGITTTDIEKNQDVAGVWLEDVVSAEDGLFATVQSGMTVDILMDSTEINGSIAKGDAISTFTVAGESRSSAPAFADFQPGDNNTVQGSPLGAYAEALGLRNSGTSLVRARLLGQVGHGADVFFGRHRIAQFSDLTVDGTFRDLDVETLLQTFSGEFTKIKPFVGVYMSIVAAAISSGASGVACGVVLGSTDTVSFPKGPEITELSLVDTDTPSGNSIGGATAPVFIGTSGGTGKYDEKGGFITYEATDVNGALGTIDIYCRGYRY